MGVVMQCVIRPRLCYLRSRYNSLTPIFVRVDNSCKKNVTKKRKGNNINIAIASSQVRD